MNTSQFHLLATRRFLPLFIVQFLGAFNDNVFKSALVVLIAFILVSDSQHAQMLINLAGGIFILPFFLFSATAGQLADKLDRTLLIKIIKFAEILFMTVAALGFAYGQVSLLMLTLFLMGTHSAFFGPIKYSALPNLLHPSELLGGNGLVEAGTFIAILIGTIAGTQLGVSKEGAIIAATVAIAMAAIGLGTSFFIPSLPRADTKLKFNWNFLTATWNLGGYIRKESLLFFVILEISWFWAIGFVFITQFPVYTKAILGGDENIVTLFLVMFSVGIALGSLLCNRLLKGAIHAKYVPLGILGMSLFTLDLCWASSGNSQPLMAHSGLLTFLSTATGWRITIDLLALAIAGGIYIVPLYPYFKLKVAQTTDRESLPAIIFIMPYLWWGQRLSL